MSPTNGAAAVTRIGDDGRNVDCFGQRSTSSPDQQTAQSPITWTRPSYVVPDDLDRLGDEAWAALGGAQSDWFKWLTIGEAMQHARTACMLETHSNRPAGRAYNSAFSAWLSRRQFRSIDAGDRSRLFRCMDNLPAIEAWRATLTDNDLRRLNHPSSVFRKWMASKRTGTNDRQPSRSDRLKNVIEENSALKRRIDAGDGNLFCRSTSAREAARLYVDTFGARKCNDIISEIRKLIASKTE